MGVAFAHGIEDSPYYYKLPLDPTLIFFVLMVFFYLRGLRTYRKAPVAWWQLTLFFSGAAIAVLALSPLLDDMADQLFFMHMVQHMAITMVAVPMMIFGVPFIVCLRGLPRWVFWRIYRPVIRNRIYDRWIKPVVFSPLLALLLFNGSFWFWHIPKFYDLALLNDFYHLLEHAMMALTALLLWRVIIDPRPMRSPLPIPMRILYLLGIMALNMLLSAFLSYSETVWYAYELIPLPEFWQKWGRLQDQQLGGLLMWVPGGFLMFIAMTIVFAIWVARERRQEQLLERRRHLQSALLTQPQAL